MCKFQNLRPGFKFLNFKILYKQLCRLIGVTHTSGHLCFPISPMGMTSHPLRPAEMKQLADTWQGLGPTCKPLTPCKGSQVLTASCSKQSVQEPGEHSKGKDSLLRPHQLQKEKYPYQLPLKNRLTKEPCSSLPGGTGQGQWGERGYRGVPLRAKEACRLATMAKPYSAQSRSSVISPATQSLYA